MIFLRKKIIWNRHERVRNTQKIKKNTGEIEKMDL